jgi:hypothetical protein
MIGAMLTVQWLAILTVFSYFLPDYSQIAIILLLCGANAL